MPRLPYLSLAVRVVAAVPQARESHYVRSAHIVSHVNVCVCEARRCIHRAVSGVSSPRPAATLRYILSVELGQIRFEEAYMSIEPSCAAFESICSLDNMVMEICRLSQKIDSTTCR